MSTFIQTYSGKLFYPMDPSLESIDIHDIAHSLSQQCRFTGHTSKYYSVAEHSVRVSRLCDPKDALFGLLHDASEAYIVDIPTPLKKLDSFSGYRAMEDYVMNAICQKFGLTFLYEGLPPSVKLADAIMLATEAAELMSPAECWESLPYKARHMPDLGWGPHKSEVEFLTRFEELRRP